MREERLEHALALGLVELVDTDRIAGIAVEHTLARDRMGQKDRMHGRRSPAALLGAERIPVAAGTRAHLFPELVEVVRGRRAGESRLQLGRQTVIRRLRV